MRGEILGLERRRRWNDAEKLAIVRSIGIGGATVTQVAQRHDLKRQQVYAWRHDLRRRGLLSAATDTMFLPVIDPQAWLADVLARLPDTPISRVHELLPWHWKVEQRAVKAA